MYVCIFIVPGLNSKKLQIPRNHLDKEKVKILLNNSALSITTLIETLKREEIVMMLQYNHIRANYEGTRISTYISSLYIYGT